MTFVDGSGAGRSDNNAFGYGGIAVTTNKLQAGHGAAIMQSAKQEAAAFRQMSDAKISAMVFAGIMEHARRRRPAATAMWLRGMADRLASEPEPLLARPTPSDDPVMAAAQEQALAHRVARLVERVMTRAQKEGGLTPRPIASGLLACSVKFASIAMGRARALEWAQNRLAEAAKAAGDAVSGAPREAAGKFDA